MGGELGALSIPICASQRPGSGACPECARGQVDKHGRDYFSAHLEPIAASLAVFGRHAEMAGYLHDILGRLVKLADNARDLKDLESLAVTDADTAL
ncbi:MAG: hypothetical protein JWP56_2347 [Aeromicrobium sp.]|nr:hypothetical protein [Aeromicrobium sp.]